VFHQQGRPAAIGQLLTTDEKRTFGDLDGDFAVLGKQLPRNPHKPGNTINYQIIVGLMDFDVLDQAVH